MSYIVLDGASYMYMCILLYYVIFKLATYQASPTKTTALASPPKKLKVTTSRAGVAFVAQPSSFAIVAKREVAYARTRVVFVCVTSVLHMS